MLRLLEAVDDLGALTYADSLAELLALHRELRRIEMLLAQLDTSAIEALDVQIEDALRAVAKAREDLGEAHRHWPEFDLAQRLQYAEEEAKSSQARAGGADNLEARLKKSEHELIGTIQVHNQKCRPSDVIVFGAFYGRYDAALFEQICGLRREIDRIFNILKNNVLVSKHEQLKVLKASFNDAFVSQRGAG